MTTAAELSARHVLSCEYLSLIPAPVPCSEGESPLRFLLRLFRFRLLKCGKC